MTIRIHLHYRNRLYSFVSSCKDDGVVFMKSCLTSDFNVMKDEVLEFLKWLSSDHEIIIVGFHGQEMTLEEFKMEER